MTKKACLVVLTKTPGHSPVKTRLLNTYDEPFINTMYERFLDIIEEKLSDESVTEKFDVLWAIKEESALNEERWKNKNIRLQVGNNLGCILSNMFVKLKDQYQSLIFIGSDMPQIESEVITQALDYLDSKTSVIGPTLDGGFYLLGVTSEFVPEIFLQIPYSQSDTCSELEKLISKFDLTFQKVAMGFDIDVEADLERLKEYYHSLKSNYRSKKEEELLIDLLNHDEKRYLHYYSCSQ
ncbi:MAG: DUF2064 domain-containing protein [Halobacteriovoraceae bacterium]|nr:DUF2064 domain-containing protein [Halobacteriovoraceae bacterium]